MIGLSRRLLFRAGGIFLLSSLLTAVFAAAALAAAPTVTLTSTSGSATFNETSSASRQFTFTVSDADAGDTFVVRTAADFPKCGAGGSFVAGSLTTTAGGGTFRCLFEDGPASPTVEISVRDSNMEIGTATLGPLTINNVAPAANFGHDGPKDEGSPVTVSFTGQDDQSDPDVAAGFRYEYHCDGSTFSSAAYNGAGTTDESSAACTFAEPGTYTIRARIIDKDNGAIVKTVNGVVVANLAPVISSVANDGPVDEGSPATITVNAGDPGGGPLQYRFDCGNDGTYEIGPQSANTAQCTYDDEGQKTVAVRATDAQGLSTDSSTQIQIENAPPEITEMAANPNPVSEGSPSDITITATDPGNDTLSYEFDCDDSGSYNDAGIDAGPQSNATATCDAFDDDPSQTVKIRVSDGDGGSDTDSITVQVENVAPTVTLDAANDYAPDEGQTTTYSFTTDDPGVNDTFALDDFECGATGVEGSGSINASTGEGGFQCTFPDGPEDDSVSVTVSDDDGGQDSDSKDVEVQNAAPTVTITSGPTEVQEEDIATYAFTATDPGDDGITGYAAGHPECGTLGQVVSGSVAFMPGNPASGSFQCKFTQNSLTPDPPAAPIETLSEVAVSVVDEDGEASDRAVRSVYVAYSVFSACTITGNNAANTLDGTAFPDVICGFDGSDLIRGFGGDDILKGGGGNDRLISGSGKDELYGEGGRDRLETQDGQADDLVDGGVDIDTCVADTGDVKRRCP